MKLEYQEYQPRKIVNTHRHVDGPWYWNRYGAHPYVGCRSGCEFCYLRGGRYLGRRNPDTFDTLVQVKTNAAALLRRELSGQPSEIIACGDWQQPADERYRLSRAMLKVIWELRFPLFVVERSPLLLRDIDLLEAINARSWVGVVISFSNLDPALKRAFEPRSPGLKRRLETMEKLAQAGILVGASLMPIIPFAGDDEGHLSETVRATKEHGGKFVLAGGLTMAGAQAGRTLAAAEKFDCSLAMRWQKLSGRNGKGELNHGPPRAYAARLGLRVRELCARFGLADRMPRYAGTGPLALNKRLAEKLYLAAYDLELAQASLQRVWAYRKAAWAVDDWPESLGLTYNLTMLS